MSEEEIKGAGLDSQSLRVAETNLRERLFKDDGRNKAVQDKDLHELRMALIKKEADAKKKADDESKKSKQIEARMASSAAKERIRMAVEMAKLNESAVNKAKDDLEFRKINEGISDKELAKEQTKIKILEAQNESRKSNLSKVSELVALTGELTTRTDAVVRLENLIVKSSDDAKISVQEQLDIQTAVNEVLAENTGEKSAQLTMLRNDIGLSEQNLGIAIERLEAERGIALARLEATRVEEVSKVSDDLTRGRASREIINPDVREKERIEERMRRRGRGLQTGFATEKIELSQARDNKLLAEVNARITRRTGFESDLENTQNTIAQALNKLAPMTQVAGGSEKLIREKTEGVLDAKGLDKFIKEELAGDIGNIEGMGDVLRNLQDKMAEERRVREDGIKALQQEAETRIQNTALEKGLPDAGFLLKDRAKALRDSRVVNLLDSQLSTDPTTRFKGGLADRNFKERSDLMMAGDVEGLRLLDESEEFSGQIIDASAQFAQNIGRAMTDAIAKGESLGGLLRSAAADFFNTLSQAFMQKAVNNLVGQGAGEGGGFFGGILKALTLNSGGPVTGGSGARDDVPALLTGGEFVMKKGAVQKYGAGFMGALNQGQIPMMNKGGLFTPGTYGQGAMKGKNNLLDFATQAFTTGAFDSVSGGAGLASVALEPQSAALTMFGRRNSPQFAQEQASKKSAFGLYVQQINKEKQIREQEKQANKSLFGSILSFGLAFGLNSLFSGGGGEAAKKAATGGSIPYAAGVDTVPTMLSGGEFVMNAAATQRIGRGALSSMNSGGGSGDGGAVINKLDELISVSDNQGETVINITVNSDGTSSENGNADEENTNLAGRIRDVVKQVIDDEKRLGGSLRQARA